MSETLWTPGPWEFYDADESPNGKVGVFSRHYSDEDVAICGNQSKAWPLAEEDGLLIAAAPDLYAALEALIEDDGHIRACGNGGEDSENCSPECNRARAALARARGQEVAP